MNWFYESGGKQQGPVSEGDFERLIAGGHIKPETLVWQEGMVDWRPLREVRSVTTALSGVPALPGSAAPAGMVACASCGRAFPPSEVLQIGDRPICPDCKPAVLLSLQQGGILPAGPEGFRTGPAWEHRQELGIPRAVWETFKGTLFQPNETFAVMRRTGNLAAPLWYYLLTGTLGGLVGLLFQYLIQTLGTQSILQNQNNLGPFGMGLMGLSAGMAFLVAAVLLPLFLAIGAFISGGIMHVALMICGGAKQPFETTFRVVNYVQGSAALFQLLPFCGAIVGGIWATVCLVIGFSKAHEISTGRAVCAVLLPIALCCAAAVLLAASIGGVVAAAQHGTIPALPPPPTPVP